MKYLYKIILISILMNQLMGVGEAGAIFLLITPGAAPAALGEAQVAKVDDAYASYFNPAGLAFMYDVDPANDNYNFDDSTYISNFSKGIFVVDANYYISNCQLKY